MAPTENPTKDLVQTIHLERQRDRPVLVLPHLLRVVPNTLGHRGGGFLGENNLDDVGLLAAIDAPCVTEVSLRSKTPGTSAFVSSIFSVLNRATRRFAEHPRRQVGRSDTTPA
jgi:hypothetical protein